MIVNSADTSTIRGRAQASKAKNLSKIFRRKNDGPSLKKRLQYAQWPLPPTAIPLLEIGISVFLLIITWSFLGPVLKILVVFSGPVIVRSALEYSIKRRFYLFDSDYPQFLMSVTGVLKTGMSPMTAIEAAAQGLEDDSLLRREVELMFERMRKGMDEDRSIGLFGESIAHPEIELFIQAVLLSKRLGGRLSDTLERLAELIRRRQYFRESAKASVALQRASTVFILIILVFLQAYILYASPMLITEAWNDPTGWLIFQGAIVAIVLSLLWSKEITNIRV